MKIRLLILILGLSGTLVAQDYNHVFVFLNSKPNKAELSNIEQEALQAAHRKNINRLVEEGKMVVAGPFEGGGGIFIFKSGKVDEVKEWLETDPAIKANRWDIEMFPVYFQNGGACRANEPYEMVAYNFSRVRWINEIANYKMNRGDRDIWQQLLPHKQLIVVGVFPQSDGGFIIYAGNQQSSWFNNDLEDLIALEHKTLWVAKGSFCE